MVTKERQRQLDYMDASLAGYLRRNPSLIQRHLTIVFTHDMGGRIRKWRFRDGLKHPTIPKTIDAKSRKPYIRQKTLADLLGIFQQELSEIEKLEEGQLRICTKLNYAQFKSVFGRYADYIVTGVGVEKYLMKSSGH